MDIDLVLNFLILPIFWLHSFQPNFLRIWTIQIVWIFVLPGTKI